MVIQMFPGVIILVPYFMVMKTLGLLNTSLGLILAYSVTALPLCVWMLKGFLTRYLANLKKRLCSTVAPRYRSSPNCAAAFATGHGCHGALFLPRRLERISPRDGIQYFKRRVHTPRRSRIHDSSKQPALGRLRGGARVNDLPPGARGLGMVFQS